MDFLGIFIAAYRLSHAFLTLLSDVLSGVLAAAKASVDPLPICPEFEVLCSGAVDFAGLNRDS